MNYRKNNQIIIFFFKRIYLRKRKLIKLYRIFLQIIMILKKKIKIKQKEINNQKPKKMVNKNIRKMFKKNNI